MLDWNLPLILLQMFYDLNFMFLWLPVFIMHVTSSWRQLIMNNACDLCMTSRKRYKHHFVAARVQAINLVPWRRGVEKGIKKGLSGAVVKGQGRRREFKVRGRREKWDEMVKRRKKKEVRSKRQNRERWEDIFIDFTNLFIKRRMQRR